MPDRYLHKLKSFRCSVSCNRQKHKCTFC